MKTIVIASFGQWIGFGLVIALAVVGVIGIATLCVYWYWTLNGYYTRFNGRSRR